jgi:hypothetical protein
MILEIDSDLTTSFLPELLFVCPQEANKIKVVMYKDLFIVWIAGFACNG